MANKNATSIFSSTVNESVIQTMKETMSVFAEDGVVYASFALNRGKGSGAQIVPVSQLPDFCAVLDDFATNGVNDAVEENISASESVRRTIAVDDDGNLSFRCRSGKGAKPAKVHPSQLGEAVAFLRDALPMIEKAAGKLGKK